MKQFVGIVLISVASALITEETLVAASIDYSDVPYFVSLYKRGDCAGTIISPSHVLTAAHCVCGAKSVTAIDFIDAKHVATAAYNDPARPYNCKKDGFKGDVAVLEFAGAPFGDDHEPRPIYTRGDEAGKMIRLLGGGIMGHPSTFEAKSSKKKHVMKAAKKCRRGKSSNEVLLEGFNYVDTVTESAKGGTVNYDMSRPEDGAHPREAIAEDGDSGGPALIMDTLTNEWAVAGVNSGTIERNPCDYGSEDMYARVSVHADWIAAAMDPARPSSERGLWIEYARCEDATSRRKCRKLRSACAWDRRADACAPK